MKSRYNILKFRNKCCDQRKKKLSLEPKILSHVTLHKLFFAEAEFRPNFGFGPKKKISAAKNFSARISAETEIRRFSVSPKFAPKIWSNIYKMIKNKFFIVGAETNEKKF